MHQLNTHEIRQKFMVMLEFVDDVCNRNHIRYTLTGGSLLGAVRHQGFIPWDDDIDIMMPRPDYERFIKLINGFPPHPPYRVVNCFLNSSFFQPFAKLQDTTTVLQQNGSNRKIKDIGLNIDIFPCDGLPKNPVARNRYWTRIIHLRNINTAVYQKQHPGERGVKRIARRIIFSLFAILPRNIIAKQINRLACRYPFEESDPVAVSIFGYGRREEVPHSIFDSFVELPFEGHMFKCIVGYDIFLSHLYGNYRELPPKEKQVAKHDFVVYAKD